MWQRMFEALAQDTDNEYAMIDATIVRVHLVQGNPDKEAIGHSRGGLSTKIFEISSFVLLARNSRALRSKAGITTIKDGYPNRPRRMKILAIWDQLFIMTSLALIYIGAPNGKRKCKKPAR